MSIIPDQPGAEDCSPDMKQCRKCGATLPATTEYFARDKKGKLGLHYWCKPCCQQSGRQYKRENKEAMADYMRQFEETHRAERQAYKREYREIHNNHIVQYRRDYRAANHDQILEHQRQYDVENREKSIQRGHRRRAKAQDSGGWYTEADLNTLYELQGGQCCWCGRAMINRILYRTAPRCDKFTVDHLIPIHRGGSNWWWNIVLACPQCNGAHHARYVFWEWQPTKLLLTMEAHLLAAMVTETMWQYARWRVIRGIL
jgi:5-methylcytosine-specific restriction endonuclease McrA